MLRPLLARAARLIAIARFEVPFYGRRLLLPATRFAFIPNGSDLPQFAGPAPVAAPGTVIASIGRLERYKGHHRILAALPAIVARRPGTRLWIAGSGSYERELRRMAQRLGIADHVEIRAIPASERGRMAAELLNVALVTVLSEYETHPIAALEAIALGRPVLVADTSGLSELAERGLARAIPLDSTPARVAETVLDLLATPPQIRDVTLPTWDDCAVELLRLYRSIVGGVSCVS